MRTVPDWSWKPTLLVRVALRRGENKIREHRHAALSAALPDVQRRIDQGGLLEVRSYLRQEELRKRLGLPIGAPLITMAE